MWRDTGARGVSGSGLPEGAGGHSQRGRRLGNAIDGVWQANRRGEHPHGHRQGSLHLHGEPVRCPALPQRVQPFLLALVLLLLLWPGEIEEPIQRNRKAEGLIDLQRLGLEALLPIVVIIEGGAEACSNSSSYYYSRLICRVESVYVAENATYHREA